MKISYNWLREHVAYEEGAEALAELLTKAGIEAEKVEKTGVSIPHVVVAQILESTPHPNADRLSVCRVADGSGEGRQIVCGAKNYRVGDKVPLALPGATLAGEFKIKVGKLRGVESQGMLCSAEELGLPPGEDGLLLLPKEAEVGAPLEALYPQDWLLDFEVTPNRPDLLSHYGLAREVAALSGAALRPHPQRQAELNFAHPVEISDGCCPFYTVRRISGVQWGPSPGWLRQKLEAVGQRSISNIVDITNFIMLDRGQPLHAFDAAKIEGDVWVRCAEEGEEFLALDGRTYRLGVDDLVIADAAKALALAGIIGGAASAVTEGTTEVWLESAFFLPSSVRRTARRLGLKTESSYRFEREIDPAGVLVASQQATELLAEATGGVAGELRLGFAANSQFGFDAAGAADGVEYGGVISFRLERCEALLGVEIEESETDAILTKFGLRKSGSGWEAPSFRPDLTREVDLIEEIARVIGIDEIPGERRAPFTASSKVDREYDALTALRRTLAGLGLHETRTMHLIAEKALRYAPGAAEAPRLRNPLSEDQSVLRPSLLPGLAEALGRNARAGAKAIRLFEAGKVFSAKEPEEARSLGVALSGPVGAGGWQEGPLREATLFDLKGILRAALRQEVEVEGGEIGPLGFSAGLIVNGEAVGRIVQLSPDECRALDLTAPAILGEVNLERWLGAASAPRRYQEIPKYPAVTRDVAILAGAEISHGRIEKTLFGAGETLLAEARLFDIFSDPTGVKLPNGKKSLAYTLTYRSADRTLTADEVNAAHLRIKARLKSELGVEFRE